MVTADQIPDWLKAIYPFTPKRLDLDGVSMSYVDTGAVKGGAGDEAVLMLHGNPTWSFYYRNVAQAISAAGMRCVVPDHIGCGLSDKPADYAYTLAQHAKNVGALIASLGLKKVHLIVHDWGGAIGFAFAASNPGLIGKIVVLNTGAFPSPHMPFRIGVCRWPLIGEFLVRAFNGFAWPATWMAVSRRALAPEVKSGFLFPYNNWANRIATHRFVKDIPMGRNHVSWPELVRTEAGLVQFRKNPMMIIWGGKDFCFNDWFFKQWSARFPEAKKHYLADAGHYVLEDAKDEAVERIRHFMLSGS